MSVCHLLTADNMKCTIRSLGIVFLTLIVHIALCNNVKLSEIKIKLEAGQQYVQDGYLSKATAVFDDIKLFDQELSSLRKTSLGNQICNSFIEIEDYVSGQKYADEVLNYALDNLCADDLELGNAFMNAGVIYFHLNKLTVSENYLFKAKEIFSEENEFFINRHLSRLLQSLQRRSESLQYLNSAEKVLNTSFKNQVSEKDLFEFYTELMGVYVINGEKRRALLYAEKSIDLAEKLPTRYLARTLVNVAGIHMNYSDREQTKFYLDKAKTVISRDSLKIGSYHFYRGMLDYGNQSFDSAIENFQLSIEIKPGLESALSYIWLAFAYTLNDQLDQSIETIDFLLAQYLENEESQVIKINETYRDYASIYGHFGMYDKAISCLNIGLEKLDDENDLKIYTNSLLIETYAKQLKASCDDVFIDTIFNLMQTGEELISKWRIQSRFDDNTVHTYSPVIKHYSKSLGVLSDLDTFLRDDDRYLDYAFKFVDGMKAHSFKQDIQKEAAVEFSNLPHDIVSEEKNLSEAISEINLQIYMSKELDKQDEEVLILERELERLKHSYTQFLNALEKNWPNYFSHKYATNETDLETLQKTLGEDEAIIEYYLDWNTIYIFAIEAEEVHFIQTAKPKNFNVNLEQFLHSISDQDCLTDLYQDIALDIFMESSSELYVILLKDILARFNPRVKYLNIIPENELNYIPFEILIQSQNGAGKAYKHLDYLLNDYTVSIQSSAAIYLNKKQKKRSNTNPEYVGFAPTYNNGLNNIVDSLAYTMDKKNALYADLVLRGDLNDLPTARGSVAEIAKSLNGSAFLGDEATKETFINKDKSGKLIHLAMHGIADDEQPSYSQLVFSDKSDNKHLYVSDVINLDLDNVELAVLSACNTGTGKLRYGEGVQSISYAFSTAGCSSMVMSLWSVPDVQTSELDKLFFREIYGNERIDDALRNSKLSYLENASSRTSHPFYWAGLIASGKTEPVYQTRSFLAKLWN